MRNYMQMLGIVCMTINKPIKLPLAVLDTTAIDRHLFLRCYVSGAMVSVSCVLTHFNFSLIQKY